MLAASSLSRAFNEIVQKFAETYDEGISVDMNVGASSALADAIVNGAPADVFASADQANITKLQEAKLVFGSPRALAHNRLIIVVKPGNPLGITSTADLASAPGVISLCAADVPCGTYAAQALASAQVTLDESRVTRGQSAAATLDAVAEGDAVAGIVYVTDALAKQDRIDTVDIPATQNVVAPYAIAEIGKSKNTARTDFVEFVTSRTGQRILRKYGFLP